MEFRLLGPMEVLAGDERVELTGAKRRALVALLAVRPGQARPRDGIAEQLWDGDPPPGAANTVKAHVFQLRKVLGADVLETTPAGYALAVGRADVDATRFEDAVRSS